MKLADLQNEFARHLLYRPANFDILNLSGPFEIDQLMELYRNNFYISCKDYLAKSFQSVELLVGEEFFSQLAKAFIIQQPLTSASIESLGGPFASFIKVCHRTQSIPYLAAIADLDWAFDKAKSVLHIADFPYQKLQQLPAEHHLKVKFQLVPETLLTSASCPVLKIWSGIHSGHLDDIDMQRGEYVILHPDKAQGAKYYTLSEQQYRFLTAVADGENLASLATIDNFQQQLNYFIRHAVINNFILEGEL